VPCSFWNRVRERGLLKRPKVGFVNGHWRKVGRIPKDEISTSQRLDAKVAEVALNHVGLVALACEHVTRCSHGIGVNVTSADAPPVCGQLEQERAAANTDFKRGSSCAWSEVEQGSCQQIGVLSRGVHGGWDGEVPWASFRVVPSDLGGRPFQTQTLGFCVVRGKGSVHVDQTFHHRRYTSGCCVGMHRREGPGSK
jgi:hypothetical protein